MEEETEKQGGFLKYLIIILIILVVVFLSQQAYFQGWGKTVISNAQEKAGAYLSKGSNWAVDNVLPQVNDKVQSGGEAIQSAVDQQKNNISESSESITESITEKISNYFSGISDSIFHPGENNNCPAPVNQ